MLAADSDFQTGASFSSALSGDFDQLSNSLLVEHREGILLEDAFFQIGGKHQ